MPKCWFKGYPLIIVILLFSFVEHNCVSFFVVVLKRRLFSWKAVSMLPSKNFLSQSSEVCTDVPRTFGSFFSITGFRYFYLKHLPWKLLRVKIPNAFRQSLQRNSNAVTYWSAPLLWKCVIFYDIHLINRIAILAFRAKLKCNIATKCIGLT